MGWKINCVFFVFREKFELDSVEKERRKAIRRRGLKKWVNKILYFFTNVVSEVQRKENRWGILEESRETANAGVLYLEEEMNFAEKSKKHFYVMNVNSFVAWLDGCSTVPAREIKIFWYEAKAKSNNTQKRQKFIKSETTLLLYYCDSKLIRRLPVSLEWNKMNTLKARFPFYWLKLLCSKSHVLSFGNQLFFISVQRREGTNKGNSWLKPLYRFNLRIQVSISKLVVSIPLKRYGPSKWGSFYIIMAKLTFIAFPGEVDRMGRMGRTMANTIPLNDRI